MKVLMHRQLVYVCALLAASCGSSHPPIVATTAPPPTVAAAPAPAPVAPVAPARPSDVNVLKALAGEGSATGSIFGRESALGSDGEAGGGLAGTGKGGGGGTGEGTIGLGTIGAIGRGGLGGSGSGYGYGGGRLDGYSTESYAHQPENAFHLVKDTPLSTFSIDVDTASYSNVRRFLTSGQLPADGSVRVEELINYFPYHYATPKNDEPFAANVEVASCPWAETHRLLRIGIRARDLDRSQRPSSNLVFLVDVSGSMMSDDKLPLLKRSLRLLVDQLDERDSVAIVTYAGSSGVVLPPTRGDQRHTILTALDRLGAGGSTNGAAGLQRAYELAGQHFLAGGTNRVILTTDGDFNVGVSSEGGLVRLIEKEAKRGVFLSVLGFGMGNLKDSTMEKLADRGNGHYAYIDTLQEARKVLVEQMTGSLITIAKDVKLQIELNPGLVQAYRQVGYENRQLKAQDFNDDKIDAGDIGAGHRVTALYEIVPVGVATKLPSVDPLKYRDVPPLAAAAASGELATVKIRYKPPAGPKSNTSKLSSFVVTDTGLAWKDASEDFRFAAAVAEMGMLLSSSTLKGNATWARELDLAKSAVGSDERGYRKELVALSETARRLASTTARR